MFRQHELLGIEGRPRVIFITHHVIVVFANSWYHTYLVKITRYLSSTEDLPEHVGYNLATYLAHSFIIKHIGIHLFSFLFYSSRQHKRMSDADLFFFNVFFSPPPPPPLSHIWEKPSSHVGHANPMAYTPHQKGPAGPQMCCDDDTGPSTVDLAGRWERHCTGALHKAAGLMQKCILYLYLHLYIYRYIWFNSCTLQCAAQSAGYPRQWQSSSSSIISNAFRAILCAKCWASRWLFPPPPLPIKIIEKKRLNWKK